MALFWHNHFATAYSKLTGAYNAVQATKMMALKPGDLPGPPGQIELFRRFALGNFRNLLIEVARDPAMLVWLDGRQNVRNRPQENFAREIMELFTWESATTRNRMCRRRASVHWLEPAQCHDWRQCRSQHVLRVRLQPGPA